MRLVKTFILSIICKYIKILVPQHSDVYCPNIKWELGLIYSHTSNLYKPLNSDSEWNQWGFGARTSPIIIALFISSSYLMKLTKAISRRQPLRGFSTVAVEVLYSADLYRRHWSHVQTCRPFKTNTSMLQNTWIFVYLYFVQWYLQF